MYSRRSTEYFRVQTVVIKLTIFYLSGHLNGPNPRTVNNTQWQVCWIKGIEDKMLLKKCLYRSRLLTNNTWQRGRIPLNPGCQNLPTLSLGANIPIERSSYPKRFPPSGEASLGSRTLEYKK